MTEATQEHIAPDIRTADSASRRMLLGLLWCEWQVLRATVWTFLSIWLTMGWVLLVFFHPGWILVLGAFLAFSLGEICGGWKTKENSEEFTLGLPPTRSIRYMAGLCLSGGLLLAFQTVGLLAIGFDLPQMLWSIFVDSGLTEPFPEIERKLHFIYPLAFSLPICLFACCYAMAANAQTTKGLKASVIAGWLITLLSAFFCLLLEQHLSGKPNGYLVIPVQLAITAVVLYAGHQRYIRKEGITRPGGAGHGSGLMWVLVVGAIIFFFLVAVSAGSDGPHQREAIPRPVPLNNIRK